MHHLSNATIDTKLLNKGEIMPTFDKSLRPQDDYFGYVNNNWLAKNPIPPDESAWGTFYVLRDKSADAIKKIVDELSNKPDDNLNFDQKLIKTYFSTAMSYASFRKNHLSTINFQLQKIRDITSKKQLAYYLGYAHRYDFGPFWSNYISLDDKNSIIQVLRIHQGGLCLPGREYYLSKTKRLKLVRKEYEKYFKSANSQILDCNSLDWKVVFGIELKLAKASWTDIALRDVEKNYTRFKIKELQLRFPDFDWLEYFKGHNWNKPSDNIVVDQPSFIDSALETLSEYSLDDIKQYLCWNVIDSLFGWVDETTAKTRFNFYGKIISGKVKNSPLWKRTILQADETIIGEILGREYVFRNFPESSRNAVIDLVKDIRCAYHKRIDKVLWMNIKSKKLAHKKLDNIRLLIGHPSIWRKVDKLKFCSDNHLENLLSAQDFDSDFEIAKIGQKPNPDEWYMNAQTVNAYHDPNQLVICFPAGILQPPFYDPMASYASNLGGIGATIGHEFTHGFDDQGSEFDERGNVNRWLTKSELKAFNKIAKIIINQANAYEILPKTFLKGRLVIGEAIADIGGLEIAIEALVAKTDSINIKKSLRELFVNAATFECGAQRDEQTIRQVMTDPHPPSIFRINCVLPHIDLFYKTYDLSPSDKLYLPPEKRAHIW